MSADRSRSPRAHSVMDFFDAHFHVWDISADTKSGHDSAVMFPPNGEAIYRSTDYEAELTPAASLVRHTGGVWVEAVSVCHVELSGPEYSAHCLSELQWVGDTLGSSSLEYLLVPTAALEQPDAEATLAELAKDPRVRGIRQILNTNPNWPRNGRLGDLLDNQAWRAGFLLLKKFSLSFDMQLNPPQFAKAIEFLSAHPDIVIVLNHLGTPTLEDLTTSAAQYWSGMEAFAKRPNTFVKISMLCYADKAWGDEDAAQTVIEAVHRVISLFGARQCMFASNYPVDSKDAWTANRLINAFLKISAKYSDEEARELWAGSARRAYRA